MNAPTSTAVLAPTVKAADWRQVCRIQTTQWRNVVNPPRKKCWPACPSPRLKKSTPPWPAPRKRSRPGRRPHRHPRAHLPEAAAAIRENMERAGRAADTADKARPCPTPKATSSAAWKWWNTPPPLATCNWASWPTTWPTAWTPTPCCSPGRVRRHHAVQLPRHDPAVDVPHGHCHGQHLRAQALEQDPMVTMRLCELALEAGIPRRAERGAWRRRRRERHLRPR